MKNNYLRKSGTAGLLVAGLTLAITGFSAPVDNAQAGPRLGPQSHSGRPDIAPRPRPNNRNCRRVYAGSCHFSPRGAFRRVVYLCRIWPRGRYIRVVVRERCTRPWPPHGPRY